MTHQNTSLIDDFVDAGMNEIAARIMVAALRLFADKGYAATTVREIVRAADVTNPMLYYYFDSKEGVFVALMETLFDSMAVAVEEITEQESTLRGQLREIARAYFDTCLSQPETVYFIYSVLFGPRRSRPSFDVPDSHSTIDRLVANTIQRSIDDGDFQPHPGLDALYLTDRFMGLINNHLMGALGILELEICDFEHTAFQNVEDFLGVQALESMLDFFFGGAGTYVDEEK